MTHRLDNNGQKGGWLPLFGLVEEYGQKDLSIEWTTWTDEILAIQYWVRSMTGVEEKCLPARVSRHGGMGDY